MTGVFAGGDAQVTHVYTTPGTYRVTLRVINLAGDEPDDDDQDHGPGGDTDADA